MEFLYSLTILSRTLQYNPILFVNKNFSYLLLPVINFSIKINLSSKFYLFIGFQIDF